MDVKHQYKNAERNSTQENSGARTNVFRRTMGGSHCNVDSRTSSGKSKRDICAIACLPDSEQPK
jgi:hypothetical protein